MCDIIGNNSRSVKVKALFDSGSQQTYAANRLVKILNLKPLREISMLVKTFASEAKRTEAKEYEIIIKAANGEAVPVKAVGVPTICDKIAGQVVKKAVKKHPFLQTLR